MRSPLLTGLARPSCSLNRWRSSQVNGRVAFTPAVGATRKLSSFPQARLRSSVLQPSRLQARVGDVRCFSLGGWWTKPSSPFPETPSIPTPPELPAASPVDEGQTSVATPHATPSEDAVVAATSTPDPVDTFTTPLNASSTAVDTTTSLTDSIPHVWQYGDMAALDLIHWTPAGFFPWLIEVTHVSTSLPIWSTIILTTIGARAFLLPFVIRATRTSARLAPLQPQLAEIRTKVDKARVERDSLMMQQAMLQQQSLFRKANVNPFDQIFMSVLQICVQFGYFIGIRRMCTTPVEQFKEGGIGFFLDLTAPDPYYILPIMNTLLVNAQLTISRHDMMAVGTPAVPHLINALRVFSLIGLPFMAFLPSAVNLHLTTSISFIALQTFILRQPALRARLGIPPRPAAVTGTSDKAPSMMDSVRFVKKWMKDKQAQAMADALEREAKLRKATRGGGR